MNALFGHLGENLPITTSVGNSSLIQQSNSLPLSEWRSPLAMSLQYAGRAVPRMGLRHGGKT